MTQLQFSTDGLIPAVIQDDASREVLTLCYLNEAALRQTLQTGQVHVYRRSKGRVMLKGETSGHVQDVVALYPDCEGRSLVIRVTQHVAGCHAGYFSCYYRRWTGSRLEIAAERVFDPDQVYGP